VEKFHFPFAILSDTDRTVGQAYGLAADAKYAKRITFVIGPDGKVEQVIDPVDAKTHPDTLLKSLP
jgi:peroxiredoxin Q/BCP